MLTPVRTYTPAPGLQPLFQFGSQGLNQGVSLPAFSNFVQGGVLGYVPNTNAGVAVNDQWTISISGSPGTFTTVIGGVPQTFAYNVPLATMLSALQQQWNIGTVTIPGLPAQGPANIGVTGTPGSSYVLTFQNALGGINIPEITVSSAGGCTATIVHTTPGQPAGGYYNTYASGNSDGSQIPQCCLQYSVATNGQGQCVLGGSAGLYGDGIDATGGYEWQAPAWFEGYFKGSDLFTIDSNAISAANGYGIIVKMGSTTALTSANTIICFLGSS